MIGPTGRFGETIGEMVSQREGEGNLWNRGVLFVVLESIKRKEYARAA